MELNYRDSVKIMHRKKSINRYRLPNHKYQLRKRGNCPLGVLGHSFDIQALGTVPRRPSISTAHFPVVLVRHSSLSVSAPRNVLIFLVQQFFTSVYIKKNCFDIHIY